MARFDRPFPGLVLLGGLLALTLASAQERNPLERGDRPPAGRRGNPLDPDPAWAGVFVDAERRVAVALLPHETDAGRFEGLLVIIPDREEFEVTGEVKGDLLEGTFGQPRAAERFPFSIRPGKDGTLELTSGASVYTLQRDPNAPSVGRLRRELGQRGRARADGNEAAAVGALKTLNTAQTLFREGDKEGDGELDYGTLEELSATHLIDSVLGSGQKQGYRFACRPSTTTPEFLWWATAAPVEPGVSGSRYFVTNHAGVIYYSTRRPFEVDPSTCAIPPHGVVLGKAEPAEEPQRGR